MVRAPALDGANVLDHRDQMRLQGLITRARLRDDRIDSNADRFLKRAADSKAGSIPSPFPDPPAYDPNLCRRILAAPPSAVR